MKITLLLFALSIPAFGQTWRAGLIGEYYSDCAGVTLPDHSGNGNDATLENAPVCDPQGLTFKSSLQQRVSIPDAVYAHAQAALVCADTTSNLTGATSGMQPLFGSNDPNGIYMALGQGVMARQTQFLVSWRGQGTTAADGSYGMHCAYWGGGNSAANLDTLLIDGKPILKYHGRVDMLCPGPFGCVIPGAPLTPFGHGYLGYTNQPKDDIGLLSPAYLDGKISAALFWSVPPVGFEMQAFQAVSAGMTLGSNTKRIGDSIDIGGDSRAIGSPYSNPCYGANHLCGGPAPWPSLLTTSMQVLNMGVSGSFCDDMVARTKTAEGPLLDSVSGVKIAIWFCGTNSLNDTSGSGMTPEQLNVTFLDWCAYHRAAGHKTLVITEPYRAGTGMNGISSDLLRKQINVYYAMAFNAAQVDQMADAGNDPGFGTASGFAAGGALSTDGVHFTAAGNVRLAAMVTASLSSFVPSSPPAATVNSLGYLGNFISQATINGYPALGFNNSPQVAQGLDIGGGLRVSNAATQILGGAGIEINYYGGSGGFITGYDRTSMQPKPLHLNGSALFLGDTIPIPDATSHATPLGLDSLGRLVKCVSNFCN